MTDTTDPKKPVAWAGKDLASAIIWLGWATVWSSKGKDHYTTPLYGPSLLSEYERVKARLDFHMTDASRMFSKEEASGVCPTLELCFEYGDRARCGPCAVKASKAQGIEIDDTHSHLPEVCRLRREVKEAIARSEALGAENKRLREALEEGRRAIGDHFAPNDCYATGPRTGNYYRDLIECPACSFIGKYEAVMVPAALEASR